jgi:hypothetical protein
MTCHKETKGVVLCHWGLPLDARYFSWCPGGHGDISMMWFYVYQFCKYLAPTVIDQVPCIFLSGARSPPVTCSKSRKNCIISSILLIRLSSYGVRSLTKDEIGSIWWSSSVAHVVLPSTNESPGCVYIIFTSTDTREMWSKSSHNAVSNSWFSRAKTMGKEQLRWSISYNIFLMVLLYEVYDNPNPLATWCSNWVHRRPIIQTELLD